MEPSHQCLCLGWHTLGPVRCLLVGSWLCKSMGPDRLQPGALGELAAALAERLSISFEKLWWWGGEPFMIWGKQVLHHCQKRLRITWAATGQPASLQSLGKKMEWLSEGMAGGGGKNGEQSAWSYSAWKMRLLSVIRWWSLIRAEQWMTFALPSARLSVLLRH